MAAVGDEDDGDFDDESLIRWRRHKRRAQSGARGTGLSTGSTRMTTAGRGRRERDTASGSPHTTKRLTNGQSSNQRIVATPPTTSAIVDLDLYRPMCSGVVMECSSGCWGVGQGRAGGGQGECQETSECTQQDMRCGEAVDGSGCTRSKETEVSCGETVAPEEDCASLNGMETQLVDKSGDVELLFESQREDQSLAVDGVCNITSTAMTSSTHPQTVSSINCCGAEQFVGSLQEQPFTSAPQGCSEFNSIHSAKRRRRGSVPLARGRWRRSPAGHRTSSMTLHSSGQTSLLQFATTVHKSVSDSLQARRQNRASYSGLSHAAADHRKLVSGPRHRSKEQCSAASGEQVAAVSGATTSRQDPCLPGQELGSGVNTASPAPRSVSVPVPGRVSGCRAGPTVEVPAVIVGTSSGGAVGRGRGKVSRDGKRQCPFYKRVPGI